MAATVVLVSVRDSVSAINANISEKCLKNSDEYSILPKIIYIAEENAEYLYK